MRRRYLWVLMAAIMLLCTRSLAITGDNNGDGIISLDETGEIVAMLQTRLRELDYFHFKADGTLSKHDAKRCNRISKEPGHTGRHSSHSGRHIRRAKRGTIVFLQSRTRTNRAEC